MSETDESLFQKWSPVQGHGGLGVEPWFGISGVGGSSDGLQGWALGVPLFTLYAPGRAPVKIKVRAPLRL